MNFWKCGGWDSDDSKGESFLSLGWNGRWEMERRDGAVKVRHLVEIWVESGWRKTCELNTFEIIRCFTASILDRFLYWFQFLFRSLSFRWFLNENINSDILLNRLDVVFYYIQFSLWNIYHILCLICVYTF